MSDDALCLHFDGATQEGELRKDAATGQLLRAVDPAGQNVRPMAGKIISLIEERTFMRECIRAGLEISSGARIMAFSSVHDYQQDEERGQSSVIMLACSEIDEDVCVNAFNELLEIESSIPIIVLGPSRPEFLAAAIANGAKGYIPLTTKFEVAVAIIRIVLAGGTYVPIDCLPSQSGRERGSSARDKGSRPSAALTARELSVVRAIQLGKPNKAIAYSLNMTESTVKVHVRHIMAKLKAKNRTEIAVMSKKNILESADDHPLN